jgi:ABC-2 type transport system ATP-binding protein
VIRQEGKNKTVLFSSHILQEVEAICDRVIIINKGEIVADDKLATLQKRNSDKHIVIVNFKGHVEHAALEKIKQAESIEQIETTNPGESTTYKLHTSNPEAVRKQILEISLQNNFNIVSLQSENQSLEEVFRALTQKSE